MQLFKQKHVFPVATKSCELTQRYLRPSSAVEDGNFDSDESWEVGYRGWERSSVGCQPFLFCGKTNIGNKHGLRARDG